VDAGRVRDSVEGETPDREHAKDESFDGRGHLSSPAASNSAVSDDCSSDDRDRPKDDHGRVSKERQVRKKRARVSEGSSARKREIAEAREPVMRPSASVRSASHPCMDARSSGNIPSNSEAMAMPFQAEWRATPTTPCRHARALNAI
jgi:hypothetical protein